MKQRKVKPPDIGTSVAKLLWPNLELIQPGDFWDKYGIDALLNGEPIQIKWDTAIARTGNVYHEIYEKTALHSEQEWRRANGKVSQYIFTTRQGALFFGYRISINALANKEAGRVLQLISPNQGMPTSMGFLIPLDALSSQYEKRSILVSELST